MVKSQSFVSVVIPIDIEQLASLSLLQALESYLACRYSDFEILLIVQKKAQPICLKKIDEILSMVPAVRYLQLASNVPLDTAFAAGLENAIGDFIVFTLLDRDPIKVIGDSVECCKQGFDVVVGTSSSLLNSFSYTLLRPLATWLLKLVDYRLPQNCTHFRCISRRAANAVMSTGKFYQELNMRIQKSGYPHKELQYELKKSITRTIPVAVKEMLRLVVYNSSSPIRLMSLLGLIGSGLACLFSLYAVLAKFFMDDVVSGWASTVLIISLFTLIQFIILSFISEYLGRILSELRQHQSYSVVYERNSLVMLNNDRINVMENSEDSDDKNYVQTGRDR